MNGIEIGELMGLLITKVKDDSKKLKIIVKTDLSHIESFASIPIKEKDKNCIITGNVISRRTITVKQFVFELQRQKCTKEIIFDICDNDFHYAHTNVPKFADIKIDEEDEYVNIVISVKQINIKEDIK